MGFLDKKERILDIVLTARGRELMSQHQLNIQYYAFSDDGVDYTGSLVNAQVSGTTMDGDVYKTPLFEANIKNDKLKDLSYFLYTVPERSPVLPDIRVGVDLTASVVLERRFHYEPLSVRVLPSAPVFSPHEVIVRAKIRRDDDEISRTKKHVKNQYLKYWFKIFGGK